MSGREKMTIGTSDVGTLNLGAPTASPARFQLKPGDCTDCKGPCKGHPVVCAHPPGSRQCDVCTLHDDDEVSAQAKAAKKQGTRKYSSK